MRTPHLHPMGTMTIFYVPSHKLDSPSFYQGEETARTIIHKYLVERHSAYTQTPTPVKGYWVNRSGDLVHDVMERFEVSFNEHAAAEFERLTSFLVSLCEQLDEDAIYVTRGNRSYLVTREPYENE